MITYSKEQQKQNRKMIRKSRPKKRKEKDVLDMNQSSMFDPDGYLYSKYAIAKTTWSYCWRCGKKININHTNEITTGVHKECNNTYEYEKYYPYQVRIQIG